MTRGQTAQGCDGGGPKSQRAMAGWWRGVGSVLEHVAEQLLHGGVANGAAEEEQLHALGGEETQRGQEQQQLPEPGGQKGWWWVVSPPPVPPAPAGDGDSRT